MANTLDTNLPAAECYGEVYFLEDVSHSLADKVLDKVQDGSYSWQDVVAHFNQCLLYLAGRYNLLDLEHVEDVLTDPGVNYIQLPANYMKNLWHARSLTHNRQLSIHNTLINTLRLYSVLDQTGVVREVSVKGRRLYYQRVPGTAESLRLIYYRYPDRMRTRQDKPTCLPPHLVEPLLVSYACWQLYSEIEDGLEGQQIMASRYKADFTAAETDLLEFVGPDRREPVEFPAEIEWDAFV